MEVVFVCTGNICRSPMAEYLLREKVLKAGLDGLISVSSAGVMPMVGWPASANACAVMAEQGIDMKNHRASALTPERANSAALILTMTREHKERLKAMLPKCCWQKIYTLLEYASSNGDIADPYGGDMQVYRHAAAVIADSIDDVFDKIVTLAKNQEAVDEN